MVVVYRYWQPANTEGKRLVCGILHSVNNWKTSPAQPLQSHVIPTITFLDTVLGCCQRRKVSQCWFEVRSKLNGFIWWALGNQKQDLRNQPLEPTSRLKPCRSHPPPQVHSGVTTMCCNHNRPSRDHVKRYTNGKTEKQKEDRIVLSTRIIAKVSIICCIAYQIDVLSI